MRDHSFCLACGTPIEVNARIDRKYCNRTCNNRHYKAVRAGRAESAPTIDPVARLAAMTPEQLGWVAGIVEGEGSIGVNRKRHRAGYVYVRPLVQVSMVDEDVIRRLHAFTGLGRVSGPHLPPSRKHHQPSWHWHVHKAADAWAVMDALWPLLGERRRQQVLDTRNRVAEETRKHGDSGLYA